MAYVGYEDIKPALIHRRILPSLRKYYRQDGTFDLFDIKHLQMNCIKALSDKRQAGLICHQGRESEVSYGSYSTGNLTTNNSTFTKIELQARSVQLHSAHARAGIIINLENNAGLFPWYLWARGWGDKGGSYYIKKLNKNTGKWEDCQTANNEWSFSAAGANIFDWKDVEAVQIYGKSDDGSKYTSCYAGITAEFIHRYNKDNLLIRYYT